jgi:CubicO group peptidase (beta-lactamase class C family)
MKKRLLYFLLLWFVSFTLTGQTSTSLERSTPESEGISSEALLSFINAAEENIDAIHSLMVVKNGKVVTEGWWRPYNASTPHELWSLSKSFTSSAIGFAVQEGLLSPYDLVMSFFSEKIPNKPTWQLKQLRIIDLLTMTSGHMKEPTLFNLETDWEQAFLNTEIPFMPGTHFLYNTPATFMLSAIIQKITGEKLVDYLTPRLFEPLGIEKPKWELNPMGVNTGGWGLHLKTEDIAKFGQFYLQLGNWNGEQLLSETWIKTATSKQVSNGSNPANDWTQGYGYQFWQSRHNSYRADGAMGQFCLVIPDKNMVVAITSGTSNMPGIMQLVWDILLPASKEDTLPADLVAFQELKQKTASLSLKPVAGMESSELQQKWFNKKYLMAKNEQGIIALTFKVDENGGLLIIDMANATEKIPYGFKAYTMTKLKNHLPFSRVRRSGFLPKSSLRYQKNRKIATSGAWQTSNELELKAYLYETPVNMNYNFSFSNKGLVVTCKAENYLGRSNDPQILKSVEHD